jgi:UDP-N-acetylmuramate--alanine ligase
VDVVTVIQQPEAIHLSGFNAPVDYLIQHLQPGDVLLVLSAGDADQISRRVLEQLTREYEGSYGK